MAEFDPVFVGLGRSIVAAVLSLILLQAKFDCINMINIAVVLGASLAMMGEALSYHSQCIQTAYGI